MEMNEFVDLVARMRVQQRSYFRERDSAALRESKKLEKEVDRAVEEMRSSDTQPMLFT